MAAPRRKTSTHSVRVDDDLWKRATKRAQSELRPLNTVIVYLLQEYAEGRLLPDARIREGQD